MQNYHRNINPIQNNNNKKKSYAHFYFMSKSYLQKEWKKNLIANILPPVKTESFILSFWWLWIEVWRSSRSSKTQQCHISVFTQKLSRSKLQLNFHPTRVIITFVWFPRSNIKVRNERISKIINRQLLSACLHLLCLSF